MGSRIIKNNTQNMIENMIAGVILNGGRSTRMGSHKSQLKLNGQSLINIAKKLLLNSGLTDIYISGSSSEQSENQIPDRQANLGPLAGIQASLNHLKNYTCVLFIPVDMPLLQAKVLVELCQHKNHPLSHFESEYFPLLLQNNTKIRTLIDQQIKHKHLAIHQLIKALKGKTLTNLFPPEYFLNANTPAEWDQINRIK